ncbi:MAG: dicarboxylate/amino acid:cation symporter [Armatimonadetes bacterium]|nr:dicarboxylate/amino acid:cation symporter [Armatimonadota bacterium]
MSKAMPLHNKILIGLGLGAVAGVAANLAAQGNPAVQDFVKTANEKVVSVVGDSFLAMIFMIVVPLLFSALVLGISEIGDVAKVGRIGVRSLVMTVVFSGIAVAIALVLVNTLQPGRAVSEQKRIELQNQYEKEGLKKEGFSDSQIEQIFKERSESPDGTSKTERENVAPKGGTEADPAVIGVVPKNPLLEATRALSGGILPFMFFALVFGLALAKSDTEVVAPVRQFMEGLFEISQKVIEMAMSLAPYGVFALIFKTASTLGLGIFVTLGAYAGTVLLGLGIHLFLVYSILIKVVAKRNPWDFFRRIRNVMLTAFATSSSNATLPVALKSAEEDLGLPKNISSFVLTVGATANQNGTALFEGITVIFFCQLFGIPLDLQKQLMVLGLSIVAGIGTAGVPGGSWPVIGSIVKGLGVPAGAIGMAIGVDRILDMSRTVLNVTGDIAIAACVAEWEGQGSAIPEEAMG